MPWLLGPWEARQGRRVGRERRAVPDASEVGGGYRRQLRARAIIKLNPSAGEAEALRNLHLDDNNRLNPDGEGWVVRVWLQLTDDPGSHMILRQDRDDPSTESRIALPRYSQFVVDSERLWHAAYHPGPAPRYALIASFESGPVLQRWIASQVPVALAC